MPVRTTAPGAYEVITSYVMDEFAKSKIAATNKELTEERAFVAELKQVNGLSLQRKLVVGQPLLVPLKEGADNPDLPDLPVTPVHGIEVKDNGPGVPEDLMPHLFDPFVTTKPTGSGLGLALVSKIVGDHGGVVECESRPKRTTFRVMLPLHEETP